MPILTALMWLAFWLVAVALTGSVLIALGRVKEQGERAGGTAIGRAYIDVVPNRGETIDKNRGRRVP